MNQTLENRAAERPPAAGSEGPGQTGPGAKGPLVGRWSKLDRIFTRSLVFSAHLPVRSVKVARRCGLAAS